MIAHLNHAADAEMCSSVADITESYPDDILRHHELSDVCFAEPLIVRYRNGGIAVRMNSRCRSTTERSGTPLNTIDYIKQESS